jgi:uncharacterized repeat protein (TIGR03803 family)
MTSSADHRSRIARARLRTVVLALAQAVVAVAPNSSVAQSNEADYRFKTLYEFCTVSNCKDGGLPWASLIQDAKGNLYGTTPGNVFRVTEAGKEAVLYTFTTYGTGGSYSTSDLIRDSAGNLYGTTQYGGDLSCDAPYGCGVVFKVDTTKKETVLYRFKGGKDGMQPWAGLTQDAVGNFYGTTYQGGDPSCGFEFGCGTVFKLDKTGKETVLHRFAFGADSGFPAGGLVMDKEGNLYGTTYGNGTAAPGTVYKVTKDGKETVLHTFKTGSDGDAPMGSLIMDTEGNLYGTTSGNPGDNFGTVFKMTPKGKETVLYRFLGVPDGQQPQAGVVMDAAGNLYGTTLSGGNLNCKQNSGNGCGTVFKVSKNGNETLLYEFVAGSDGGFPRAGVLLDSKGNLYGTTPYAGSYNECELGCGVVFELIY